MKKTKRKGPAKTAKPAAPWLPPAFAGERAKQGKGKTATGKAAAGSRRRQSEKVADKTVKPAATTPRKRGWHDPQAQREALRYENPIASREAILGLLADGPLYADQIAERFELTAPDRFEALQRRLGAMIRDGQLLLNRRGSYAPVDKLDLIAGTLIANPEGFGFLRPDAGGGDDVFLPPGELRKALHGDRLLVNVTEVDRRGRRSGSIVEVLERRQTRVMGRFDERDGIAYVVPDDRRIVHDILIPRDAQAEARQGQLVVCEITQPPQANRPPFGRVLTVLGERLRPVQAVQAALAAHAIEVEFPQAALAEAAAVPLSVPEAVAAERVDLRATPLVTIDGEDARDFDDAVWCEPARDGWRLLVAIADVSHYVRPGTALDDEAQNRATSVYFPGFVVPMLPESLSNGICSINPQVERLCFVCDMRIGADGEVQRSRFYEAVMRSHARLTYTQVGAALDGDADAQTAVADVLPQLRHLHALYAALAAARRRRGAIEFETSEVRFVLGAAGEVVQAGMQPRNDAHRLIEECMIAANVQAARFLLKHAIPTPFRVHDRPPESKYGELQDFLAEFSLRLPPWSKVVPGDFTRLLHKVRKRPEAALLETVLLRAQSLAVYAPDNIGHFGLALDAYAHFTSPIRRYADLLVHRAIKHVLNKGKASDFHYAAHEIAHLSLHCSERGRRADEASREVDERYRAAWMEQHVGGEFAGVISGVTGFGLFVELAESRVTGMVHVTQMPTDYWHFDPQRKELAGEGSGLRYRLGDAVRIRVLRASVEERRIDFRLLAAAETSSARAKGKGKQK